MRRLVRQEVASNGTGSSTMKILTSLLALLALSCAFFSSGGAPGAAAEPATAPSVARSAGAEPASAAELEAAPREASAAQGSYEALRSEAEVRYAEGSFELARRVYEEAAKLELATEDRRWVEFRLADTLWRAAAASNDPDSSRLDAALRELERIVSAAQREEEKDRIWAEAQESYGDFYWRQQSQLWWSAWPHYEAALGYWGGSSDVETARARYLDIVFSAAQPAWHQAYWGHGSYSNYMPVGVLENAVAIAKGEEDLDRAHFLLGVFYVNQGQNTAFRGRAERELGAVIEHGKKSPWYDDALYHLGTFLENYGRATRDSNGSWVWKQDFVGALTFYRKLLKEFEHGETSWYHEAENRAKAITEASVWASVDQFFLPGSEITYRLGWRNAGRVDLALFQVDLTRDVEFDGNSGIGDWLDRVRLEALAPVRSFAHDTKDAGDHRPGQIELRLEDKLPTGAYVLVARAGGKSARALVLVSDVALTTKLIGGKVLAWFTSVQGGAPVAEAKLRLWQGTWDGGRHRWREAHGATAADGTHLFDLGRTQEHPEYFVAASIGDRQAYVQSSANPSLQPAQEWRLYAFTDRPAYRPKDKVSWKVVARRYDGTNYSTPANETLDWEILDPRGATAAKGTKTLGAFGTLSGEFSTDELMPLGEFQVRFFQGKRRGVVGQATLFRLEEYKLPEFEVSVKVPRDGQGRPKLFRVGDRVEAEIEASYYFGGPVTDANVEVFVHQRPFGFVFPKEREFPWFYEPQEDPYWGGYGQQVAHQILKTDRAGKATFVFDTPPDSPNDLEYTIEARVTDASRREILGQGNLKVTRSGYFVQVAAEHAIHRPGAKIELELEARDANGNPVAAKGQVTATRQRWIEIWCDTTGREVFGDELARLRERPFPPAPGWWCRSRGYEEEVVASATVAIGADGKGAFEFTPPREGHYQIVWRGIDDRDGDVEARTTVFVADESTRELGYLSGGIEILLDQDTLEVGGEAVVLLVAPASGRHVLFTVEGLDLYHHEVLRLDGTVKLVRLPVTEIHVPNCWLGAISIADGQAFEDREELVVPPTQQFLGVELGFDREAYEPGTMGSLQIRVRDRAGNPVRTELAVAVVDESVTYIQADLAGDPRQFFYGGKRWLAVQTAGTWNHGNFRKLVEKDGKVADERYGYLGGKDGFRDDEAKERMRALGYEGDSADQLVQLGEPAMMKAGRRAAAPAEEGALASRSELAANAPGLAGAIGQGGGEPVVRVRSDFRETALWIAEVVTDDDGETQVDVSFPDSTTRWKATVRSCDAGTRVGIGEGTVKTRQPLIARLQGPRFFLVGDEVTLSGNLNNNTDSPMAVRATLELEGLELLGRIVEGELVSPEARVEIAANDQARLDWRVRVTQPGEARLLLKAVGAEHGDAVERRFRVWPHGIDALVATAGKLEPNASGSGELAFALELPPRAPGSTKFVVQVTPSLAVTMLDALPYLVDYPYGCTEQTLSRFLPSVIVLKTLRDFGLSPEEAMERVFGGVEGEFAAKTHPKGKQALAELDAMVEAGLERLYDFQHGDGGWAWWKEGDSDRYMTAYVLWGLSLARDADLDVRAGVLESAARFLARELVDLERQPDLQAWCLHALAVYGGETGDPRSREWIANAFANLWKGKDGLNAYGRALLAISAKELGHEKEARVLLDNLVNGAKIDRAPDASIVQGSGQGSKPYVLATAHWGEDGILQRWSQGGVEATAFVLRALMAIDPGHELVAPAMNWLVKNRRGAQWSNTRDTAIVVLAMNEYLRASGELGSDVAFEVEVNGAPLAKIRLAKNELLRAPSEFSVSEGLVRDGTNRIVIKRTQGTGPLYFAARAHFFSLEEPIEPRGNELFVRREYWKLVGRPTLLKGYVYERVLLEDGDAVQSGERIEVVLSVEAKNHLEYLVFEDLKPAGFEATEVKSGEEFVTRELKEAEAKLRFLSGDEAEDLRAGATRGTHDSRLHEQGYTGRTRWLHQELRDRKVAIFADQLPQGFWEMRYELRAEAPGSFHALPALAHAMYVPEIRANGAELQVEVTETPAR